MKCKLVNPNYSSNYTENLMKARGIDDLDLYLDPPVEALQSPSNLKNIGMAAAMYLRIVTNDQPPYSRILIIVD